MRQKNGSQTPACSAHRSQAPQRYPSAMQTSDSKPTLNDPGLPFSSASRVHTSEAKPGLGRSGEQGGQHKVVWRSGRFTQPSREAARLAARALLQPVRPRGLSPNPPPAFRAKTREGNQNEGTLWIPAGTPALPACSLSGVALVGINRPKKSTHQTSHICGKLSFNSFGLN